MPSSVQVDRAARRVWSSVTGQLTVASLLEIRAAIDEEARTFDHVMDLTGVEELCLTTDEIRRMARSRPIFEPNTVHVVVAPAGSAIFGVARMFQVLSEESGRKVEVVPDRERALAFLESLSR